LAIGGATCSAGSAPWSKKPIPTSSRSGSGEGFRCGRTTGIISTGETYKNVVKMTFAKGAALKDPSGLFNSSLDGNTRRAIDFHEGERQIDEEALKTLVRAAVTLNKSHRRHLADDMESL
jgi:hypothetical protein